MRFATAGIIAQVQLRLPAASPGVIVSAATAIIDPDSFPLATISRPGALVAGLVLDTDLFRVPSITVVTPPQILRPELFMGAAELIYSPEIAMSGPGYTFDSATASAVTLSNNNLTATHATNANNSGVRGVASYTVGKYYSEFTVGATHGNNDTVGIASPVATYTQVASGSGAAVTVNLNTGAIGTSGKSIGAVTTGTVIGVAANITGLLIWFRRGTGSWNGDPTADPLTGIGGVAIPSNTAWMPVVGFAGGGRQTGDNVTANFGASAYVGTQPSGFVNWPTGVMLLAPNVLDSDIFRAPATSNTTTVLNALRYVDLDAFVTALGRTQSLSAARAGLGSVISSNTGADSTTENVPDVGVVTLAELPVATVSLPPFGQIAPALYVDAESYGATTIANTIPTLAPALFIDPDNLSLVAEVTARGIFTTTKYQLFLPPEPAEVLDTVIEAEVMVRNGLL